MAAEVLQCVNIVFDARITFHLRTHGPGFRKGTAARRDVPFSTRWMRICYYFSVRYFWNW